MKLTVLGKYGPYPKAGGSCSGYIIEDGETVILLELGSGTFSRLLEFHRYSDLSAIIVTHLHADHCADLAIARYAMDQGQYGKEKPLLISPAQKDALLFRHIPAEDGLKMSIGGITVKLFTVHHTVECYGVKLTNGEGKSVCYTSDTSYFDGLVPEAFGADILLADTNAKTTTGINHMSPTEAGKLAERAQVKKLLCTHISGAESDEAAILCETGVFNAEIAQERTIYEV